MNPDRHQNALNQGDRLHWYEIESILGHGGFGITYLALDTNLNHKVAIKEYLPVQFATRVASGEVQPISDKDVTMFDWGKQRFLDEARTLAPFKHPNIVRVLSFFEFNNTGYIVMEYVEGVDLADLIRAGEPFTEGELLGIINPVIEGLALVHEQGFIHRDIKPRNIVIRSDGSPVLIDFGSARQALGEQTQTLTSLVTPGYSPLEQYHGAGGRQGPWTDIYALGATLYAAATGRAPIDSMMRSAAINDNRKDPYQSLVEVVGDKYSRHFLLAIDRALAYSAKNRPQNLGDWQDSLGEEKPTVLAEEHNVPAMPSGRIEPTLHADSASVPLSSPAVKPAAAISHRWLVLLAVIFAVGFFTYPQWISMPDIVDSNPDSILENRRPVEDVETSLPDSEPDQPMESTVPPALVNETETPPTVGTVATEKGPLPPAVDVNGMYRSEITHSQNDQGFDGQWYFGAENNLQVKIEQRSDSVVGFIEGSRQGRIEGSYAGNEINFRFNLVDPAGNVNQGVGVWFVASDGNTLVGRWFLRNQQDGSVFLEGDWKLTRLP